MIMNNTFTSDELVAAVEREIKKWNKGKRTNADWQNMGFLVSVIDEAKNIKANPRFTSPQIRELINQYLKEEISLSRLTEILNQQTGPDGR